MISYSFLLLIEHRAVAGGLPPAKITFEVEGDSGSIAIAGSDARVQLLVVGEASDGSTSDVTRQIRWSTEPSDVVAIDERGYVQPLRAGKSQVTAVYSDSLTAMHSIEVVSFDTNPQVNFPNQVVPVFTKLGCNGGGCHGRAAGQNGFRLSLLGFEPREDYDHLVKESRGRRLAPASPDQSLLLTKAINAIAHGGGPRLDTNSQEYRIIRRWISQGMPYGNEDDAKVVSLEISPKDRPLQPQSGQQLAVHAMYSNGRVEDITRLVQYDSNDADMADVDVHGLVTTKSLAGTVAIMARYQGQVATFVASIPLNDGNTDGPTWEYPTPTNPIDTAVIEQLKLLGIPMSELCEDSTFIRRVMLDICGRLPRSEELNLFLSSSDPNRRAQLIDQLLDSGEHADFFANKWMMILRNRPDSSSMQSGSFGFHRWIREQILRNVPYDRFVREIVAASGSLESNPATAWYRSVAETNSRVEDTAQLFLGQRIQCARCHHHPLEKWSQRDYFQLSAYFSTVRSKPTSIPDEQIVYTAMAAPRANHPKTGESLAPAALDGPPTEIADTDDPRQSLVDWMIMPSNPFFAKSLANRYWKHFLGRGLVEPEDDLRVTNPPSNPQLLNALANGFVESGFDLRLLIRSICNSRTYQTSDQPSSVASGANLADRKCYSRFYPKRLAAEVLVDAMDDAVQSRTPFDSLPDTTRAVQLPNAAFSNYFLTAFGRPSGSTACECERATESTLAQSLHLVNSKEMQAKVAAPQGRVAKISADPSRADQEKLEELYLAALSRLPTSFEMAASNAYLQSIPNRSEAFEDILWALLNSKEFQFNH